MWNLGGFHYSVLCTLVNVMETWPHCHALDKAQHLSPEFLAVDLQRNQELYLKPMQAEF